MVTLQGSYACQSIYHVSLFYLVFRHLWYLRCPWRPLKKSSWWEARTLTELKAREKMCILPVMEIFHWQVRIMPYLCFSCGLKMFFTYSFNCSFTHSCLSSTGITEYPACPQCKTPYQPLRGGQINKTWVIPLRSSVSTWFFWLLRQQTPKDNMQSTLSI